MARNTTARPAARAAAPARAARPTVSQAAAKREAAAAKKAEKAAAEAAAKAAADEAEAAAFAADCAAERAAMDAAGVNPDVLHCSHSNTGVCDDCGIPGAGTPVEDQPAVQAPRARRPGTTRIMDRVAALRAAEELKAEQAAAAEAAAAAQAAATPARAPRAERAPRAARVPKVHTGGAKRTGSVQREVDRATEAGDGSLELAQRALDAFSKEDLAAGLVSRLQCDAARVTRCREKLQNAKTAGDEAATRRWTTEYARATRYLLATVVDAEAGKE